MSLDDVMLTCLCLIDDALPASTDGKRVWQVGPQANVSGRDVITSDVIGRSLGLTREKALSESFRRHARHVFPVLAQTTRPPCVRQATTVWAVKEHMWMWVRDPRRS